MKIPDKTPAIRDLADRIMHAEVGARIRVVDHWEADQHAIGFARRGGSSRIIYVSSWQQPEGSFHWSLESRSGTTVREGSADVDGLIRVVDEVFPVQMSRAG